MTEAARLHPDDIDAIAARVVALLSERAESRGLPTSGEPISTFNASAADIAQRIGMSPGWVREHTNDLAGVRIGNGKKPRIRFNPTVVDERVAGMRSDRTLRPTQRPERQTLQRSQRASQSNVPLLPIKGRTRT